MSKFTQLFDRKLWKFLLVGGINTLVGSVIMFGLYNLAGWGYWLSSAMNYGITSVLSFFLNKYFTFQNRGWSLGQIGRFVLNILLCYGIAYGVAQPLCRLVLAGAGETLRDNVSMLVGMGLFTGLNYLGQRLFAFRETSRRSSAD